MTDKYDLTSEIAALGRHLDAHGSRPERWTEPARQRFLALIEREAGARRLLAEARALDRLLDRASSPVEAQVKSLTDRIVGIASREAQHDAGGAVIDLASRRDRKAANSRTPSGAAWRIAAALAASLVAGVFLGNAAPVVSAVQAVADAVGLTDQPDYANLALFDDGTEDEEAL